MAVSAAAPVMADELTSNPAVYAMSSIVRTIINGQEYTRETAYSTIRYYFDYNFNLDSYSDLEIMMDIFQMDLDVLNMGDCSGPMYEKQAQECKLCISLIQFLMDTL